MKTPTMLLGAALVFWGWQTGLWILAAVMAIIYEASHLIRMRWDLATADFRRISNGCTVIFIVLLIYIWVSKPSAAFIVVVIRWLPVVLFPLLAAQAFSTTSRIDIRNLFLLQRKNQKAKYSKRIFINLSYPYFAICIASAGGANIRNSSYYLGAFLLIALAFWFVRTRRFSIITWFFLIGIGCGIGFLGHIGLHSLQLVLEKKGLEWTTGLSSHDPDPFQNHTAIGEIGTLKLSNRIVFRVTPDDRKVPSMLLRETSYNRYLSRMWVAVDPHFKPVKPDPDKTTWRVSPKPLNNRKITVAAPLPKGKGVLKIPEGTFKIEQLPVVTLEKSKYGTLKVEGGPGIVAYGVYFDDEVVNEGKPTKHDLDIPDKELGALNIIYDQLQLGGLTPGEILKRIESFFKNEFQYSLEQRAKGTRISSLSHFLLDSRAGHCEYFATATVLLLRAAGIPTRYGRGYLIHEFSKLENCFVVRASHAHAWALVYLDGTWHNFDTTPGSWISIEKAASPNWQIFKDLWSWGQFNISRAWWWLRHSQFISYLWWLVLPIVLISARRFFRIKGIKRTHIKPLVLTDNCQTSAGMDSEFYKIEEVLTKAGFSRDPAETLQNWVERISENQQVSHHLDGIKSILARHYRYRFDPKGISSREKAALRIETQAWLTAYHELEKKRISG